MFNVGIALCQDRSSVSPLEAESSGDRWGARCSCGAAPCPGTSPCPDSVTGTCSSSCRWCTETAGTACSPRWSGTGVSPGSATWPSTGTGSGETWSAGTGSGSGTARRSASRGWSRGSPGDWCSSHLEMDLELKSKIPFAQQIDMNFEKLTHLHVAFLSLGWWQGHRNTFVVESYIIDTVDKWPFIHKIRKY